LITSTISNEGYRTIAGKISFSDARMAVNLFHGAARTEKIKMDGGAAGSFPATVGKYISTGYGARVSERSNNQSVC
jgi:hypothetical protein